MDSSSYFADADASFSEGQCILFGVPFEKTSSFRHGADQAPHQIRKASWNFETFDLRTGVDLREIKTHDYGDLHVQHCSPQQMVEEVRSFTKAIRKEKKFPIALGGEHSITPGIVHAYPKDIAVLSLDAHIDFRREYENDMNNHACAVRRISDHIPIENIAVVGIRSAEKEEYLEASKLGLFSITAYTIQKKGVTDTIGQIKNKLKGKKIYLTLDIDVVDPAYAPGTSTPEPYGLTPLQVLEILDAFIPSLVGFDVVEVCPPYDHGQTALLAARFIRTVIGGTLAKE
ncbi:MAG: agmatinase [Candidatus Thermoplasmatota archaeon]